MTMSVRSGPAISSAFVCRRCVKLGLWASPSRTQHRNQSSNTATLSNRRLVALHGHDTPNFLHGITTNTIPYSDHAKDTGQSSDDAFYSGFLNAQGRVLHDVFIYPAAHSKAYKDSLPQSITRKHAADEPAFLVEVDAAGLDSLTAHLKRYKLRAKVDLRKLDPDEWTVAAHWGAADAAPSGQHGSDIGCTDPRAPGMGTRFVAHASAAPPPPTASLDDYTRHRHLHGVPEGQASGEIPREHALPHECNMDLMHGIDFRKGCYVGQELTIRTQHKGVVRKRVLPVRLYDAAAGEPPSRALDAGGRASPLVARVQAWDAADIVPRGRKGRPAGRWVHGAPGDVGLAMCRIEMMTDVVVSTESGVRWREGDEFLLRRKAGAEAQTGGDDGGGDVGIKAFMPDWVRSGIKVR